jgi:hypothetical protein
MESLFTGRDRKAGTDTDFDQMLEQALRSKPTTHTHQPDTTRSAREFALAQGWPLPQPERGKWRRCVLVILGALLATLLLGRLLENLNAADQQPTDTKLDLSAIAAPVTEDSNSAEAEGSSVEATGPVFVDPFADWAPRAVLEKLPASLVALPVRRAKVVRLPR